MIPALTIAVRYLYREKGPRICSTKELEYYNVAILITERETRSICFLFYTVTETIFIKENSVVHSADMS